MKSSNGKMVSIIHSFMDWYGGAEKIAVDFTIKLSERGFPMEFVTGKISGFWLKSFMESKKKIVVRELGRASRGPMFWISVNHYATQLKNLINKNSQLLMPQSFPGTLAAAGLKDETGVPCIWYCHDPTRIIHETADVNWPFYHKIFFKIIGSRYMHTDVNAVNKLDRIVANSKFTAKKIKSIYGFDERKIDIIYPGIAVDCCGRQDRVPAFIRKAQLQGNRIIFCPGALSFHKNFANILKALQMVHGIRFKAIFTGGRNEQIIEFQRAIKKLGIEERILHFQRLLPEEIQRVYVNSDLVVYVPINEPFGLIALEALGAKTPVVVSNTGGVAEIVQNEVTGLKVDPCKPHDIREAIERILMDKEESMKMGERGVELVRTKFNIERTVDNLVNVIDEALMQR